MAQVYFTKDGTTSDTRASEPRRVPIEALAEKLTPFEKRYFDDPPDLNPAAGPAAAGEPFRHVLVKVDESEINAVFPDAGYYVIHELAPDEFQRLFDLPAGRA